MREQRTQTELTEDELGEKTHLAVATTTVAKHTQVVVRVGAQVGQRAVSVTEAVDVRGRAHVRTFDPIANLDTQHKAQINTAQRQQRRR